MSVSRIFALCVLLAFVVLFGYWVSTASTVELFLINENFDPQALKTNLYRVDTALGTTVFVGQVSSGTDAIELVIASPDQLYTFDRASNTLITISASDASILSTVPLDQDVLRGMRGFDLSPIDGKLYGIFAGLNLRTINPATGATTLVTALTGVNTIEAIAFAPDGTLYAAASPFGTMGTHLYTIDLASGVLSLIGNMGLEIDTLGYASDGFLYGARGGPGRRTLYRINPATALRTTAVGDTGVNSIIGITEPAVEPPVLDVSIDIEPDGTEQECSEPGGTIVQLTAEVDGANITSFVWTIDDDDAGSTKTITAFLELGQHSVQVDVMADNGATGSATETITVADTTAPQIEAAFVDPDSGQTITQIRANNREMSQLIRVTDVCDSEPVVDASVGIPSESGDTFRVKQVKKSTSIASDTNPDHIELPVSATDASGNTATENIQLELVK